MESPNLERLLQKNREIERQGGIPPKKAGIPPERQKEIFEKIERVKKLLS